MTDNPLIAAHHDADNVRALNHMWLADPVRIALTEYADALEEGSFDDYPDKLIDGYLAAASTLVTEYSDSSDDDPYDDMLPPLPIAEAVTGWFTALSVERANRATTRLAERRARL